MRPEMIYQQARLDIIERRFINWQGLPRLGAGEGPPVNAIFPELLQGSGIRPQRYLGESFRPVTYSVLDLPGYYRPTLSMEGETLVLFDAMLPELDNGLAPLLNAFGEPAIQLDWFYGTLEMPGGEWLFPERGISLFLNQARDRALHLALYAATDQTTYLDRLRPHLRKTLHP